MTDDNKTLADFDIGLLLDVGPAMVAAFAQRMIGTIEAHPDCEPSDSDEPDVIVLERLRAVVDVLEGRTPILTNADLAPLD